MKTTIDLPDDLLIEARKRAAEERTTLRAILERGLREQLARTKATRRPSARIQWVTVRGGLPPDVDLSDRAAASDRLRRNR